MPRTILSIVIGFAVSNPNCCGINLGTAVGDTENVAMLGGVINGAQTFEGMRVVVGGSAILENVIISSIIVNGTQNEANYGIDGNVDNYILSNSISTGVNSSSHLNDSPNNASAARQIFGNLPYEMNTKFYHDGEDGELSVATTGKILFDGEGGNDYITQDGLAGSIKVFVGGLEQFRWTTSNVNFFDTWINWSNDGHRITPNAEDLTIRAGGATDEIILEISTTPEYSFNATHFDLKGNTCVGCGGGGGDIISEGDSSVEVIDLGTGEIEIDIDGTVEYTFNGTDFDMGGNVISKADIIEFDEGSGISFDGSSALQFLSGIADGFLFELPTGEGVFFQIQSNQEYSFNATNFEMNNNQISGSMTATDNEILRYNATADVWQPTLDIKSGNIASILDGASATITFNTAFASTPNVVATFSNIQAATDTIELSAISTTAFTITIDKGHGGANDDHSVDWIATNAGDP